MSELMTIEVRIGNRRAMLYEQPGNGCKWVCARSRKDAISGGVWSIDHTVMGAVRKQLLGVVDVVNMEDDNSESDANEVAE